MTTPILNSDAPSALAGLSVIDCDSHLTEPADLWTSRAPARYRQRVPRLRRVDGRDVWYVEGDTFWSTLGTCVIDKDGVKRSGLATIEQFEDLHPGAHSVRPRLALLDRLGIHAQVVYPNAASFGATRFLLLRDEDLRNACVSIYNDAAAELQRESGGRLVPQALLPFWEMKALLREARRCTEELGLRGFTIPDQPQILGQPDYGDPYWSPFWELCSDRQVPLNFHIGAIPADLRKATPAWSSYGYGPRSFAVTSVAFFLDIARTLINLLFSETLQRYPGLRFVSVESGVGWIPFLLEACDYQFREMGADEVRKFDLPPGDRFRRNVFVCFWFEEASLRSTLRMIGAERVLFETDFPHPTCLHPGSRTHLARVLEGFTSEERRCILQDNAADLYRIALPS